MSKSPNRTKLVTFRLSEREFDAVQRGCSSVSVASVSEFARSAIFRQIEELSGAQLGVPESSLRDQLQIVTVQLQALSAALTQLRASMMTALAQENGLRQLNHGISPQSGLSSSNEDLRSSDKSKVFQL